jgi:hypothetical protein
VNALDGFSTPDQISNGLFLDLIVSMFVLHWTPARDESALFAPRREAPKGVILSEPCAVFPALNGEVNAVKRAAITWTSTSYVSASTLPCMTMST